MKQVLKEEARALRESGKSVKEISKQLLVSSSTVSRWCKDIILSDSQRAVLDTRRREVGLKALAPWIALHKQRKVADQLEQHTNGRKDLGIVSARDLFMLGLGLYWGEGYKRGSQECGFTNSDPSIIRTVLAWFSECYGVGIERIIARVTINNLHVKDEQRILSYWSDETGIPLGQFGSSTFITGYGKHIDDERIYNGTLRIKVRNGTSLRRRILASIEAIEV